MGWPGHPAGQPTLPWRWRTICPTRQGRCLAGDTRRFTPALQRAGANAHLLGYQLHCRALGRQQARYRSVLECLSVSCHFCPSSPPPGSCFYGGDKYCDAGGLTQARNKRYNKTGHLFQGRYKAILIQKDLHLLEVCRYVVLNPVRAKMVEHPADWEWSSYWATAGKKAPHPCLTKDWVLGQFSRKRGVAEILNSRVIVTRRAG
ncbi:MAG: hypothetical protein DDT20_01049 [Firmicutes bacterium]|nr:hypothetical protein [Bacillota bacterium]